MRRSSGTRFRHSPAARRIVFASCVGVVDRVVARDRLEVVVAQLDADRAARRSPCAPGRRSRRSHSAREDRATARRGRASRAGRARTSSRARSTSARSRSRPAGRRGRSPRRAATRRSARRTAATSCARSACASSPIVAMPSACELRGRLRADAVDACAPAAARSRSGTSASRTIVRPSGLSSSDAIFASSLFGATAIEHDEPGGLAHGVLERARDVARAPPRIVVGLRSLVLGQRHVGQVDVDLVDAAVLDLRRDRAHRLLERGASSAR